MGRMRRIAIGSVVALLAVGLLATPGWTAKGKKVKSEVELEGYREADSPPREIYIGDVHAKKNKCERDRHVTVYYDTEAGPGENFVPVGTDTTDRTGDFEVVLELIGDDDPYYATVDKRRIGSGDKKLVCKADESPEILIGGTM
jgi:hypothetical protein